MIDAPPFDDGINHDKVNDVFVTAEAVTVRGAEAEFSRAENSVIRFV